MSLHSDSRKLNWAMIGVICALVTQAVALVFWGGGLNQRVSALERTNGPLVDGSLSRLDERTLAIQSAVERLERRQEQQQ